jgi:hypothetical protein
VQICPLIKYQHAQKGVAQSHQKYCVPRQYCRHKIFNADWTIDGVAQAKSLFAMIRNTYQQHPERFNVVKLSTK